MTERTELTRREVLKTGGSALTYLPFMAMTEIEPINLSSGYVIIVRAAEGFDREEIVDEVTDAFDDAGIATGDIGVIVTSDNFEITAIYEVPKE